MKSTTVPQNLPLIIVTRQVIYSQAVGGKSLFVSQTNAPATKAAMPKYLDSGRRIFTGRRVLIVQSSGKRYYPKSLFCGVLV
jgi:hypothetical protein